MPGVEPGRELSAYVEASFDAWARWAREPMTGRMASPAWLMMQSKRLGLPARSTVMEMTESPVVLIVDTCVAHLEPKLGRVFKVHYLQHAPAEVKSVICRVGTRRHPNVRKFYRLLRRAKLTAADEFLRIEQNLD